MDYKLSVIIPTFNAETYLIDAVNSVKNQTFGFENIELILVDDNSTDNTKNITEDLSKNYDNIIPIFLDENTGSPSIPRNIGIKAASTPYIMFMDNDDIFYPEMCEVMYNKIISENVDVVVCKVKIFVDSKEEIDKSFFSNIYTDIKINSVNECPELMSSGKTMFIWNKIFNKNVILNHNIKFPDNDLYEDVIFSTDFYLHANGIYLLNNFFGYEYRVRSNNSQMSTSQHFVQSNLVRQFKGLKKLFNLLNDNNVYYPTLIGEILLGWTKLFLLTDLDNNCQDMLIKRVQKYYKDYPITTKFVNYSIIINIMANCYFKILSVFPSLLLVSSKFVKFISKN